jgi:hypothetical protein
MSEIMVCRPRSLPIDKLETAARRAIEINPANALERRSVARTPAGRRGGPRRIAVVVAKKWPATGVDLSVSFMDTPSKALRGRILEHMNAWGEFANVRFRETNGLGQVRIARLDSPEDKAGYWSWVGTEILEIEDDEPTLNLDSFTMKVSESEFRRVVRHEAGHTLGFDHEHMRSDLVKQIDREKAFAYFEENQGWSRAEVEEQVLTPLETKSLMGTKGSDPLSIMCYQLPKKIMKKGKPAIPGGKDINPKDAEFAAKLYPRKSKTTAAAPAPTDVAAPPAAPVAPPRFDDAEPFHIMILDDCRVDARTAKDPPKPEFAQVLATYSGARVMSALRLRAPAGRNGKRDAAERTAFGRIIAKHERIRRYTNENKGSLPTDEECLELGGDLFDTLLQGDIRRLYDEARAREGRRLGIVLTSMIPWIAEKPWEFAFDAGRKTFLATEETYFVRNVLTAIPADPIKRADGPLSILVASAQPVGFGRLSIDQEVAVIRRGFEPLIDAGLAKIDVIARTTPRDIHGYLSTGQYQIVHFIGHGVYDEATRQGALIFQNERDAEYRLGERETREIFCGRGLSLVFLNACESGRGGRADFNKGIAQSLVQHGLPAVVANQYTVLDSSATAFAQHFYWSLGQGMSLGQSAREARIAVNYAIAGEPIDWAIPVVYARDPHATVCEAPAAKIRVPATMVRAGAEDRAGRRQVRVAVWDMDDVFPALEGTLDAMNAVQSVFGFELVDLPVPLDVWEREGTKSYLHAERLAGRLRAKPQAMGVDVLACITRHPMEGDGYLDIYSWWSENKKPPIVVFSAAGFDDLEPEGPVTDRVIANELVAQLAGFLGKLDSHGRKVTRSRCPMWDNPKRDFEHLTSIQEFDAPCRRKLSSKLPAEQLAALEKLLGAFADSPDGDDAATRTTRRKKRS